MFESLRCRMGYILERIGDVQFIEQDVIQNTNTTIGFGNPKKKLGIRQIICIKLHNLYYYMTRPLAWAVQYVAPIHIGTDIVVNKIASKTTTDDAATQFEPLGIDEIGYIDVSPSTWKEMRNMDYVGEEPKILNDKQRASSELKINSSHAASRMKIITPNEREMINITQLREEMTDEEQKGGSCESHA